MRTFATLAFIAGIASLAIYLARRPTIASGAVLGADLLQANPGVLRSIDCDPEIPVGVDGATFGCRAEYKDGSVERVRFAMDRQGQMRPMSHAPRPRIKHSSDPWGD